MLYKNRKNVKDVGNITYEVISNDKFGVKITDSIGNSSSVEDIFDTYKEAVEFVKLTEKFDVTPISVKNILEDYLYDKYQKKLGKLR